jgi:hypothetical protein
MPLVASRPGQQVVGATREHESGPICGDHVRIVTTLIVTSILFVVLFCCARAVDARPQYFRAWLRKYLDVAKRQNVTATVKCGLCHVDLGKGRKTSYGVAIGKALATGAKQARDDRGAAAIDRAFDDVAREPSGVPGKTFGDLLRAGELPLTAPELAATRK